MSRLTVVASGKGGVGKTTLAANLAACLAKRGKKVIAFDCDVYLKNLDIVFGVQNSHIWDIGDVFEGRCKLEDAVIKAGDSDNLFLVAGPLRATENPQGLTDFILKTAKEFLANGEYDHIILDCPSGAGHGIEEYFIRGSHVIVVATPDLTSIHDAQITAAAAYAAGADVSLVVNRIRAKSVEDGTSPDMDEIIDSVGIKLLGLIPEDGKTSEALNAGKLITDIKRSRSKKSYANIAARVDGEFTELYRFW